MQILAGERGSENVKRDDAWVGVTDAGGLEGRGRLLEEEGRGFWRGEWRRWRALVWGDSPGPGGHFLWEVGTCLRTSGVTFKTQKSNQSNKEGD